MYKTQILNIFKRKRITFTFYENPFVRRYSWWIALLLICLSVFSFKEVCRSKVIGSLLSRAWWHLGRHQSMVGFFYGTSYNARFIMPYNFGLICTLTPQISMYLSFFTFFINSLTSFFLATVQQIPCLLGLELKGFTLDKNAKRVENIWPTQYNLSQATLWLTRLFVLQPFSCIHQWVGTFDCFFSVWEMRTLLVRYIQQGN